MSANPEQQKQQIQQGSWTPEQQRALDAAGRDILVAAGAGSGKTRVLVERVLQRITGQSGTAPLDIDRFLVVTFTNAAAAEMRHRIAAGLKTVLAARPGDEHARRQLLLLNRAQISTIHAFCLEVIRRYAYLCRLDTAFRILDENEARLLRFETLEDLLEEQYAAQEPDSPFYRLIDLFSTDRGDRDLQDLVLRLHDFSRSHPYPEAWLREQAARFAAPDPQDGRPSPWEEVLLQQTAETLDGLIGRLEQALALAAAPAGPEPYLENLEEDLAAVRQAREAARHSWDALARALQAPAFNRLKSCRGNRFDVALKERASALRKSCKTEFERLKVDYFQRPLAEQRAELRCLAPVVAALVDLVLDFDRAYQETKREKALADFPDLEHRALQLLTRPDSRPDHPAPSEAALDYRRQFAEILVDEYQDINPVQEIILQLVSLPQPGGNRFMVGDVKQSIYRFRLAEPVLFQEKYRAFPQRASGEVSGEDPGPGEGSGPAGEEADHREEKGKAGGVAGTAGEAPGQSGNALEAEVPGQRGSRLEAEAPGQQGNGLESEAAAAPGECIVLSQNFRSRGEILDGVNDLFSQFMDEDLGEVRYDTRARLRQGTAFPTPGAPLSFLLIDREGDPADSPSETPPAPGQDQASGDLLDPHRTGSSTAPSPAFPASPAAEEEGLEELGQAELEGRLIAQTIREILGLEGGEPLQIYDREQGRVRPAGCRDVVILLRSARNWAPALLEALRQADIPAYVDLGTGYFAAVEVEVVLSLLRIIDNPFQDIPLGAVLRSPLAGLDAEELAAVRNAAPAGPFFEALQAAAAACPPRQGEQAGGGGEVENELAGKLQHFLQRLYHWQDLARQDSLASLIWDIYRETGYYEMVGGLPGGRQRQANLRALYDRARQYEAARFRGLFRFLRFIDGVRERGGDLGEARALGEQENVVRIMTVHKSKGLEFPLVFVAGLGKNFNLQDTAGQFLVHKHIGFGPRYLDLEKGISYPTLAWHAVRQQLLRESLSEEMRILYVAMTRAEERLYLVGSVRNAARAVQRWAHPARSAEEVLPAPERAQGRTALDWIGPALLRHPQAEALRAFCPEEEGLTRAGFPSRWTVSCLTPGVLQEGFSTQRPQLPGHGEVGEAKISAAEEAAARRELTARVARLETIPGESPYAAEVERRLGWRYPFALAAGHFAKLSVSELKKVLSAGLSAENGEVPATWNEEGQAQAQPQAQPPRALQRRPAFMGEQELSPGERGAAYHGAMQHLSFSRVSTVEEIAQQLQEMAERGHLTPRENDAVEAEKIFSFFQSPLGQRVLAGKAVYREVPFSLAVPLEELYTGRPESPVIPSPDDSRKPPEEHQQSSRSGEAESRPRPEKEPSLNAPFYASPQEAAAQEGVARETAEAALTGRLKAPGETGGRPPETLGDETVLVQGVVDCLVLEENGFLLIDFKTGSTRAPGFPELLAHYRLQLSYYGRAVEQIWREPVAQSFLYFFDEDEALEIKRPGAARQENP